MPQPILVHTLSSHTLLHIGGETSNKNENSVAVLNDVNPISPIANKVSLNSIGEIVGEW